MKMKEKEVIKHYQELSALGGATFPAKLNFAISYNLEKFQRESDRVEKERQRLCKQYSDKDEEGEPIKVKSIINGNKTEQYKMSDKNQKLFNEEYDGLLDEEVEIEIRTVKREVVERCEEVERYSIPTVAQLFAMTFMLED